MNTAVEKGRRRWPCPLVVIGTALLASAPVSAQMWPAPAPAAADPALDAHVRSIVSSMTLEQKVGQMTQADIRSIKPDDVRRYYIGSVLNGGGAWPSMNMHASAADWLKLSEAFYRASMSTDMKVKIPVIWGVDAVHGHNNVYGATLFPHNIGLGAAHDPELVERIGRATAEQVRATGLSWTFAPTVAVVENPRWGRTYESYSSDPALVERYAEAMVRGLQGKLGSATSVIATAKHWLGDGGTFHGKDQGVTRTSEANLARTQAAGYYGAIRANVRTVMVSYSSFTDTATGKRWGKMTGNAHLVGDVLKRRLGFNGLVVSDWNAIGQVPGCTNWHCPRAIDAGLDMVMVPQDWKKFIAATVADVRAGRIPMSRIDDAVSRIIRVKLEAGLFRNSPATGPRPSPDVLHSPQVRALAREAVRKSLVLLKNNNDVLPLRTTGPILVVGAGANSIPMQTGGWSLTWQGDKTSNADYPFAQTLLSALRGQLGRHRVDYSRDGAGVNVRRYAAVIAVAAEKPYAEGAGDIPFPKIIRHSNHYPQDLAMLKRVSGKGVPVVTLLFSGRPVGANDLINRSDAFIAAWLPGTEAAGLADMLIGGIDGRPTYDFTGRLPFDWPAGDCLPKTGGIQFPRGYGLSLGSRVTLGRLPESPRVMACPAGTR